MGLESKSSFHRNDIPDKIEAPETAFSATNLTAHIQTIVGDSSEWIVVTVDRRFKLLFHFAPSY